MAEQRPGRFRFRLPWMLSSAPAPRPQTPPQATTTANTTTTTTNATQPTTTTPAVRPPFRPAGVAPSQPPPPPPAQPSSPSRAGTQSRVSSQPASPSRVVNQSRASSRPTSPSLAAPQAESPSRVGSQSRSASQLSSPSPSRPGPQSRTASQPSSPSRTTPQFQSTSQTASQPRSPSRLGSQPTGGTSSLPSYPPGRAIRVQPIKEKVTQPNSPSKTLQSTNQESSRLRPPISEKEEAKAELSQPKTEITSDSVSNSQNKNPIKTTIQPNEVATKPLKESRPVATIAPTETVATKSTALAQKSNSSTITADLNSLAEPNGNPEEEKENKPNAVPEHLTEASHYNEHGKEKQSVTFQAEQQEQEKQEILGSPKERLSTPFPNKKQNKTPISPLKARSPVSENRQKPAIPNGQRVPLHKELRDDISKFVHQMAIGNSKNPKDEKPVSVITLAGENRGASMHLGSESGKREGTVHIHRGYKLNPDDSTEATTDGEGSSKGRWSKDAGTEEDHQATEAYINNNTQGLNNSLVSNTSITERNPGVHLVLSHNLNDSIKSNERTGSLETRRAEFNITPARSLTYEPRIRRRCLRGLLMEPSDSDPDNPEKPQRHGCLYVCGEMNKDNQTDVL